jgi:hypothetical protein
MSQRPPLPPAPDFGAPLAPIHPSPETLALLALRRSTPVVALGEPGPPAGDLADMLRLAMRAASLGSARQPARRPMRDLQA